MRFVMLSLWRADEVEEEIDPTSLVSDELLCTWDEEETEDAEEEDEREE